MATVAVAPIPSHTTQNLKDLSGAGRDQSADIPDIIEEKRKDAEGRIVVNRYLKGKLLGKGGFAKCFVGLLMPSKAPYALKIVAKSTLSKSRAKQKLQTEIKIHRTLKHLHVVRFERFFEDSINAYMILELCNNNSMSELMRRRKRLTEPEARYYLVQLISALKYLHNQLVIHRDLKLGNLFIDANMKVKVGDFGLATKLTTADEKRRTICGTPNYIAPEILEGKEGHSFEVDVWSTGVILYTFLVGKPPFETKDVKSTYKRILANQYTFPDQPPMCDHAKSLIRHMLQARPEKRPSLDAILAHTFFTRSNAQTPSFLPESALRDAPIFSSKENSAPATNAGYSHVVAEKHASLPLRYGDENDPHAINRLVAKQTDDRKVGLESARDVVMTKTASASAAGVTTTEDIDSHTHTRSTRQSSRASSSAATSTNTYEAIGGIKPIVLPAPVPKPVASTVSARPLSAGYAQKFDVYCDTKSPTAHKQPAAEVRRPSTVGSGLASRQFSLDRKAPAARDVYPGDRLSDDVECIQHNFENVKIKEDKASVKEAWGMEEANHHTSSAMQQSPCSNNHHHPDTHSSPAPHPAEESEPMQLGTPSDQIMAVKDKAPGTLETMHDMLTNTCGLFDESLVARAAKNGVHSAAANVPLSFVATVWVVRYVDYTSKYGLGFLLNTGSAGVYFNDSTKIVLSPNGSVFQYIERRRKDSFSSPEHVTQTHLMTCFPPELQKKVTLLRHFRDYMVDQQKTQGKCGDEIQTENNDGQGMPMVLQGGVATGANENIKFGVSSAKCFDPSTNENDVELPFLKKWVRTRHAILFRLSNRTVQVVFFDRSEVLLSSEARIVTFVNKQGLRSEHSLEEVLQTGRTDISKRLKYTKDIMYRLINITQK